MKIQYLVTTPQEGTAEDKIIGNVVKKENYMCICVYIYIHTFTNESLLENWASATGVRALCFMRNSQSFLPSGGI